MELSDGTIRLRPISYRDKKWWIRAQRENREWLAPWEATFPDGGGEPPKFGKMVRAFRKDARLGRSENYIITRDSQGVGFIALGGISYGPARMAFIGYWIMKEYANQGIITRAVSLVKEHAFIDLCLHRIEINVRPENQPSIRVAMKSGFELEGRRAKYLHIDGAWRDHLCFVATRE
jgi:ribosomal-protein-alanine N-acetyltransferase